jgi:F0F1-type ATP synthase epsilon subunit
MELLTVLIMSPEKTLFDGKAITITCRSPLGEFDVLPEHSFFMSIINTHIEIHTPDHHKIAIHIDQAILQVSHDQVIILINVQEKEAKSLIHDLLRPDEIMYPDEQNNKSLEKPKKV